MMEIEENIKIHDNFNFEIKLFYPIKTNQRRIHYDVEKFFFIPNNLNINSHSYKKEDFFKDTHTYIRFKTPDFELDQLLEGKNCPLEKIKNEIQVSLNHFEDSVKWFCSILKASIRDFFNQIHHILDIKKAKHKIKIFVEYINEIVTEYRELKKKAQIVNNKEYKDVFELGDEFISLCLEAYSYKFLEFIKKTKELDNIYLNTITNFIKQEYKYRMKMGYPCIPHKNSNNEIMIYRKSILKKYAGSILFLESRYGKSAKVINHLSFSLAAGIAMIFATAVIFFYQKQYGQFTTTFFMILVVSYMFKDRIKDAFKSYFTNKIKQKFYDHKIKILKDKKNKLGLMKEFNSFISENQTPQDILKKRIKTKDSKIKRQGIIEQILYHKKKIFIFSKKIKKLRKD